MQVFNKSADLQHKFPVRRGDWGNRLTVSSSKQPGKILLLTEDDVHVHQPTGEFVCSFGGGVFKDARDITATCDGRVMIVDRYDDSVYIFDVEGHQLGKFNIKYKGDVYHCIACHPASDYVVLAGGKRGADRLRLAIYTVNGEFLRKIYLDEVARHDVQLDEKVLNLFYVRGITVTVQGHIAVALQDITDEGAYRAVSAGIVIPKSKVIVV